MSRSLFLIAEPVAVLISIVLGIASSQIKPIKLMPRPFKIPCAYYFYLSVRQRNLIAKKYY